MKILGVKILTEISKEYIEEMGSLQLEERQHMRCMADIHDRMKEVRIKYNMPVYTSSVIQEEDFIDVCPKCNSLNKVKIHYLVII